MFLLVGKCSHGDGVVCCGILIDAYLKSGQIGQLVVVIVAGTAELHARVCYIYCYLRGTDCEVARLGVGLRKGDRIIF